MERKVKYFISKRRRLLYLYYEWDGDVMKAFLSNFFLRGMDVEVIPKEQNRSNEDLLMVGFAPGKRFLLRIGDGILRDPNWRAARRMRREYGRDQNPFPGLVEVTDEEKIRYRRTKRKRNYQIRRIICRIFTTFGQKSRKRNKRPRILIMVYV